MDIVERLRKRAEDDKFIAMHTRVVAGDSPWMTNSKLLKEAADEIERLQEALVAAKACINDKAYTAAIMVIDTALQQKESE